MVELSFMDQDHLEASYASTFFSWTHHHT